MQHAARRDRSGDPAGGDAGRSVIGRTADGIEVVIPIGDNQAGILGLCESEQDIVLNIGTSSQISKISDRIPEDRTLECRPYIGGNYLLLGAGLCGGTSFRMLNDFSVMYAHSVELRFLVMRCLAV